MKHLIITETKPATNLESIALLEHDLKINLPPDYIKHLLTYNGGRPEKDSFDFFEDGKDQSSNISKFFALYESEYNNLKKEVLIYKNRIPKELIPIGGDGCGNNICLGIIGEQYNKVYFWDHDMEWYKLTDGGTEPYYNNLYLIANSFEGFINSLYGYDIEVDKEGKDIEISTYDKYSLPFSTQIKKYGSIVTNFFNKAPIEVKDYLIERTRDAEELNLKYEVKSENKRYIRRINKDGKVIEEKIEEMN